MIEYIPEMMKGNPYFIFWYTIMDQSVRNYKYFLENPGHWYI